MKALLNLQEQDITATIMYIKKEFKLNNLLITKNGEKHNNGFDINGLFEDDIWILQSRLHTSYIYYKFFEIKDKSIIPLVKCWVGETIIDRYYKYKLPNGLCSGLNKNFSTFVTVLNKAEAFTIPPSLFLNEFIRKLPASSQNIVSFLFVNFIEYIIEKSNSNFLFEYLDFFEHIFATAKRKSKTRKLPDGKDMFYYSYYIDSFFKDDGILQRYYMPILLWWKITMVIPMRPSEFCIGLKRDSIIKENGKFFLKIERVKTIDNVSYKQLPLLKQVAITEDIYNIIKYYINISESFGYTESLLSYPALEFYRKELFKTYKTEFGSEHHIARKEKEVFPLTIFSQLLNSFFKNIIKGKYHDNFIKHEIKPGDTRHFAFTSLMLQGYSPVEIAILGGHSTLSTLNEYTCSPHTYIDMEVMAWKQKKLPVIEDDLSLFNVFTNMPTECPVNMNYCHETEINNHSIGYCTADFKSQDFPCESEDCYKCSKWWCYPNKDNYLLTKSFVLEKIQEKDNKLNEDISFLKMLFEKSGVKFVGDEAMYNKTIDYATKSLQETVNATINLKKFLTR